MKLRVATYNIHFGGARHLSSIIEALAGMDAHIVLLVEASDNKVIRTIAENLGMHSVTAKGRRAQLAFLGRFPLPVFEDDESQQFERPLMQASVAVDAANSVMIYGFHLQPHYFYRNERQRLKELTEYFPYIDRHAGPHLLLGDFNAVAPGDSFDTKGLPIKERLMLTWERGQIYHEAIAAILSKGYTDCYRALHPDSPGYTLPVQSPHVRLDYVFADPNMARNLRECTVVINAATRQASDHFPVMAEFEL